MIAAVLSAPRRRRLLPAAIIALLTLALAACGSHRPPPDASVDFGVTIAPVDPLALSGSISTYGAAGADIVHSERQRAFLYDLGPGLYRVPIRWNHGRPVSAAVGASADISADQWVAAIKAFGGTPQIVLEGGAGSNAFTAQEAASLVRHFSGPRLVTHWVLGNEPNLNGPGLGDYCGRFNAAATAMKAVNPDIEIAGPGWGQYDEAALRQFLACAGQLVDVVDFHQYGMGDTTLDNGTALNSTPQYGVEVRAVQDLIRQVVPGRAGRIKVQVGELNWSWRTDDGYSGYGGDDRFYQAVTAVWGASVLGHIMTAGGIAHTYADQAGALGLTFEKPADAKHYGHAVGDAMPLYWGQFMFSGGRLFPGFGTHAVRAVSGHADLDVFASITPNVVVLVNKRAGSPRPVKLALNGEFDEPVDVWQTNPARPFDGPAQLPRLHPAHGQLSIQLPPYSITTLVVQDPLAPVRPGRT